MRRGPCALPANARVALGLALAGGAGDRAAPPWLRDDFATRVLALRECEPGVALLPDGAPDFRIVTVHGGVARLETDAGSVVRTPAEGVLAVRAFERFAALSGHEWLPFTFDAGADGRPARVERAAPFADGDELLVRTLRRRDGGGGALARLVRDGERVAIEALALDPASSRLPRASDAAVLAAAGERSGRVALFPAEPWRHPAWCSFDVLHADRDHPEWSGARDREATCLGAAGLEIVEQRAGAPLAPRRIAAGERVVVRACALGLERRLALRLEPPAPGVDAALAARWLDWEEQLADALDPARVAVHPVVVLDRAFEPVAGAWVIALDSSRASELASSLFCAQSDAAGRAFVPLERRAAAAEVELIAFTAGESARSGRRRGASAAAGGECVVLLEEAATTTLLVEPPPGLLTFVGLETVTGAFRVPVAAEGRLALPALGGAARVHLGPPWVAQAFDVALEAGAQARVEAVLLPAR